MKRFSHKRDSRHTESGYALVLILFFLALLVLSTVAAAPTVLSSIQREREAEMVWRGHQYTRAVRMYYMKLHRFPTALDDLTKPKTGIRFMRQAYKDPMNQVDGSWRLIYVGPNGQLIGSLMNRTIGLGVGPQMGQPGAVPGVGSASISTSGSAGTGISTFNNSMQAASSGSNPNQINGSPQGSAAGSATQDSSSTASADGQNPDGTDDPSQPHSIAGSMDASNTIGGNIIGVASKVNKKSFLWYEKAKNYKQFEFIWDPTKDMVIGAAPMGIGAPVQGVNGTNTPGTVAPAGSPGSGLNPNPVNPDPNQNPPLQAPPPNP